MPRFKFFEDPKDTKAGDFENRLGVIKIQNPLEVDALPGIIVRTQKSSNSSVHDSSTKKKFRPNKLTPIGL